MENLMICLLGIFSMIDIGMFSIIENRKENKE